MGDDELQDVAEGIRDARQQMKAAYGQLYSTVSEILFRNDPIGINFDENTDEYEPEVGTILPRLVDCATLTELRHVVYREFVRWFDSAIAGPEEGYQRIAEEIWIAWREPGKSTDI